jgi:WD40 repeat protein
MTQPVTSLIDFVKPLSLGTYVSASAFIGTKLAFALGDGRVRWLDTTQLDAPFEDVNAHPDASILLAVSDQTQLITAGDDGRIVRHTLGHEPQEIFASGGAWIDALALSSTGAMAWSVGKNVTSCDPKGKITTWTAPSSVRGVAFAPKGYRLAIAHYNGASLWYPATQAQPEVLEWKGAHLDVSWSHDGRFVITTLQENALHGWRLSPTAGHMRMTGYPAKVRSITWSHDGQWLATSGAEAAIIWPFTTKEGPTGKPPRECGEHTSRVSAVAFHPKALVLAVGYDDGSVRLIRLTDAAEIHINDPITHNAITTLAWSGEGRHLAFGATNGAGGLLTLP